MKGREETPGDFGCLMRKGRIILLVLFESLSSKRKGDERVTYVNFTPSFQDFRIKILLDMFFVFLNIRTLVVIVHAGTNRLEWKLWN